MQKFSCIARLGRDVESRYTPSGTFVASFSAAADDGFGEHKTTMWLNVSVFGKRGESCAQYLHKGSKVYMSGVFKPDDRGCPRIWNDKEGNPRASYDFTAFQVEFLDGKPENNNQDQNTGEGIPF